MLKHDPFEPTAQELVIYTSALEALDQTDGISEDEYLEMVQVLDETPLGWLILEKVEELAGVYYLVPEHVEELRFSFLGW